MEAKLKKERTSITTVRDLFRTFATFQTRLLSHWFLPVITINVPLILKMWEVIFMITKHIFGHFEIIWFVSILKIKSQTFRTSWTLAIFISLCDQIPMNSVSKSTKLSRSLPALPAYEHCANVHDKKICGTLNWFGRFFLRGGGGRLESAEEYVINKSLGTCFVGYIQ